MIQQSSRAEVEACLGGRLMPVAVVQSVVSKAVLRTSVTKEPHLNTYSDRALCPHSFRFRVVAPQIWNILQPHLKNSNVSCEQFESGLKIWLFVQAYS